MARARPCLAPHQGQNAARLYRLGGFWHMQQQTAHALPTHTGSGQTFTDFGYPPQSFVTDPHALLVMSDRERN